LALFEQLQNMEPTDKERLRLFERLLSLDRGFWGRMTLLSWMRRVTFWYAEEVAAQGARRDAIDDESIATEVLLLFFDNAAKIHSPRAWLKGTARIRVCGELRLNGSTIFGVEIDAGGFDVQASDSPRRVGRRLRQVRAEIERLPSPRRDVMRLYYVERWTTSEIAAALDLREATVRQHLRRGREQLKAILGAVGDELLRDETDADEDVDADDATED
jgi:RNA polymerase sigma factor (sigma-70 family)